MTGPLCHAWSSDADEWVEGCPHLSCWYIVETIQKREREDRA